MPLSIARITEAADLRAAQDIIRRCGEAMRDQFGLEHWIPPYPLARLQQDAIAKAVYAVHEDGALAGTFTVGTRGIDYLPGDFWADPAAPALYLSKLAIHPDRQGSGVGTWCMARVEELAAAQGCTVIRFDAIAAHSLLLRFYERLGYPVRGLTTVIDLQGREQNVAIFEKTLQNNVEF